MIKLTKDYITKLYLILVVFILVLIVCCIVTNPATAFALDDKNTASGTIVLSDVVKNEGYIELKGSPEEIGKSQMRTTLKTINTLSTAQNIR